LWVVLLGISVGVQVNNGVVEGNIVRRLVVAQVIEDASSSDHPIQLRGMSSSPLLIQKKARIHIVTSRHIRASPPSFKHRECFTAMWTKIKFRHRGKR